MTGAPYREVPTPLKDAPREVPLAIRLRVRFGGVPQVIGWLFLGLGVSWVIVMARFADLRGLSGTLKETDATITRKNRTGGHENHQRVWEYQYTFTDDAGVVRSGTSYGTDESNRVEYEAAHPEHSCLVGLRRSLLPGWIIFILAPFLILGSIFVIVGQYSTGRACRLLRDGKVAWGKLIAKHPTALYVNRQPVYAMKFEFEVDGERYETTAKTWEPWKLEDDKLEQLLYNPLNPKHATLIDHLPGAPRVGEHGEFAPPSTAWTVVTLLPVIGATLMVLSAIFTAIFA